MAKIKKFKEVSTHKLQPEYDALAAKVKEAEDNLKKFEASLKKQSLYIKNGMIKEDKEVWAVFWNITYYSHFDGHASGAVYDDYSGAAKLSESKEEVLKKVLLYWADMSYDEKKEIFSGDPDIFPNAMDVWCFTESVGELFEDFDAYEMVGNTLADTYKFEVTPKSFKITCVDKDDDQGRVCKGSSATFRLSNSDELGKIKIKHKQRRD